MTEPTTFPERRPDFPRTRWSVVLTAAGESSPESEAALEALCRAYWYPLYAYARRCGKSPHDAEDLTQEFFRLLLEKGWLRDADREKGRLRTFLVTAMKRFMAKEWRRESAQKRGGAHAHEPLDTTFAESRYAADGAGLPSDAIFDRHWALTLLDITVNRLKGEFAAAGKEEEFDALKDCLAAARGSMDYGAVAARLSTTEGAARVAAHRLRKRFREIYREEIAQTLSEEEDLDAEARHLAEVLART
jgi:DNA-directed RNA polymerase specialized sigma24 family protein